MTKAKFKVGDKVRAIGSGLEYFILDTNSYVCQAGEYSGLIHFRESELELVEGDNPAPSMCTICGTMGCSDCCYECRGYQCHSFKCSEFKKEDKVENKDETVQMRSMSSSDSERDKSQRRILGEQAEEIFHLKARINELELGAERPKDQSNLEGIINTALSHATCEDPCQLNLHKCIAKTVKEHIRGKEESIVKIIYYYGSSNFDAGIERVAKHILDEISR